MFNKIWTEIRKNRQSCFLLICINTAQLPAHAEQTNFPVNFPTNFPIQMLFRPLDNTNITAADAVVYDIVHDNETNITNVEALDTNQTCTTIVHFNYASIHHSKLPSPLPWPGYFAYLTGAWLTNGIGTNFTRLYVDHPENFWTDTPAHLGISDDIIIYRETNGIPDWSLYEYAVVTNVNETGGYIEVKRGQYGTISRNFSGHQAVVATHAQKGNDRYGENSWLINMSLCAPVNPVNGLNGAKWFAEYMYTQWTNAASGVHSDGLEFDVGLFKYDLFNRPLDCNNDLVDDGGYFSGINTFGLGGQVFAQHMRTLIGDAVIFQIDGNYPYKGFRGYKYINGLELEGFPQYNDYDNFSDSFQQLLQYTTNTEYFPHFSYPFTKQATTVFGNEYENEKKTDYRFRVGLACACLAGVPHPYAAYNGSTNGIENEGTFGIYNWDEYFGDDSEPKEDGWLGQPVGPMQRIENFGTDLLSGVSWTFRENSPYEGTLITNYDGSYEVNVTDIPENGYPQYNQIALVSASPIALTTGQEYTIVFDAIGTATWTVGSNSYDRVPSLIRVGFGLEAKHDVLADMTWQTYYISGIAATNSAVIEFALAEQVGMRRIKNIHLYVGGGDKFTREFSNGIVILNASRTDWTASVNVSNVYRRLNATPNPANTNELMAADINTGDFVGDHVVVPAMDAVFLKKMAGCWFLDNNIFSNRLKSADGATGFDLTGDYGSKVQWELIPVAGTNYYYIENMYYNRRLKSVDGAASFDLTGDYGDKVQWQLKSAGRGFYYLENKAFSNRRLRSTDGATNFDLIDNPNDDKQAQWKFISP